MSDEEFATEQEKQEVLAKLKAFLDPQIEELEAKWRDLPEDQKLCAPRVGFFFGTIRRAAVQSCRGKLVSLPAGPRCFAELLFPKSLLPKENENRALIRWVVIGQMSVLGH